ncbi:MAG: MBL fold metallo-hydrolase [Chloroflexi bacterium]|nr:MBL fold metallo-hydrolase [Chloroflexota bacterium]
MPLKPIFPHVHVLPLGAVNVFLIEDGDQITVIDTGYKDSEKPILTAVQSLGKQPTDITNIVLTHCHPDHAGSVAALKDATNARTWMHRIDAEVVRGNTPMVRSQPAPGLLNQILYRLVIKPVGPYVPAAVIDCEVNDGDVLPIAGGLKAIYTPGHSMGHLAFLLQRDGGLLFVGDACSNMLGLAYSIVYDDLAEGRRSLAKLAQVETSAICFGHGKALSGAGVGRFRQKWQA